jgi:hypothetical protein
MRDLLAFCGKGLLITCLLLPLGLLFILTKLLIWVADKIIAIIK